MEQQKVGVAWKTCIAGISGSGTVLAVRVIMLFAGMGNHPGFIPIGWRSIQI